MTAARSFSLRLSVGLVAVMLCASTLAAQVRFDPATGDYFVTITGDDGRPLEMRVVPPSKVDVRIAPTVVMEGSAVRYVWTIDVRPSSRQSLQFIEVDCPTLSRFSDGHANATNAAEWSMTHHDWPDRQFCGFSGEPVAPGGRVEVGFTSNLLPGAAAIRIFGYTEGVNWPTEDPLDENVELVPIVDSLSGYTGGWKEYIVPVPRHDPAALTDPIKALKYVEDELAASCGELAWITNHGVCNSLGAKLRAARRSLDRQQRSAARGQLAAFAQELRAQNGHHVSANAYALLAPLVEFLLRQLR